MRVVYVVFGGIFLFLGILGIPLPVLPTTPFLLLASYCFMKGSTRVNSWFKTTKVYKIYLEDYNLRTGMTLKKKMNILLVGTLTIGLSFILVNSLHIKILLACVIVIKYYYFIFRVKTIGAKTIEQ